MVRHVLDFFKQAGAQHSTTNLSIVFNFDRAKRMQMDLDHFRRWDRFLEQVTEERSIWLWSADTFWPLTRSIERHVPREGSAPALQPRDVSVRQWADANGRDTPPPLPKTGYQDFDSILERRDRLLSVYRSECRTIGRDRDTFLEIGNRGTHASDVGAAGSPEAAVEARRLYDLYQPETDYWASSFIRTAAIAAETVRDTKEVPLAEALADINSHLDAIDRGKKLVTQWREGLRELLSLPIWQRRHELYAVWVGSRIALL